MQRSAKLKTTNVPHPPNATATRHRRRWAAQKSPASRLTLCVFVSIAVVGVSLLDDALGGVLRLPMASAQQCPALAEPGCFDTEYTCERCCDTRAIPVGDLQCWLGDVKFPSCCGLTRLRFQATQMLPAMDHLQGPPAACPPAAQPHCFDAYFPCERCCDTRRGAQGDMACWPDTSPFGLRTLSFAFCCGMLPFEGTERQPW